MKSDLFVLQDEIIKKLGLTRVRIENDNVIWEDIYRNFFTTVKPLLSELKPNYKKGLLSNEELRTFGIKFQHFIKGKPYKKEGVLSAEKCVIKEKQFRAFLEKKESDFKGKVSINHDSYDSFSVFLGLNGRLDFLNKFEKEIKNVKNNWFIEDQLIISNEDIGDLDSLQETQVLLHNLGQHSENKANSIRTLEKEVNKTLEKVSDGNKKIIETKETIDQLKTHIEKNEIDANLRNEKVVSVVQQEGEKTRIGQSKLEDHLLESKTNDSGIKKSLKALLFSLPVVIILLAIILYFQWDNSTPKEPELIPHEELGELFADADSNSFKLLILPFNPDKNCRIEDAEYEHQFLDRFNEIKAKDSLNIEIRFVKNTSCLGGYNEANNITDDSNIDMIIWGRYEEECETDSKLCVNYSLSNSLIEKHELTFHPVFGTSGFKNIESLSQLRDGYLQQEIDDLIFFVLARYYYEKGDFLKSSDLINLTLHNSPCYSEFYLMAGKLDYEIFLSGAEEPLIISAISCELYNDADSVTNKEDLVLALKPFSDLSDKAFNALIFLLSIQPENKDYISTIELLKQVQRIKPSDIYSKTLLSVYLLDHGETKEALQECIGLVDLNPKNEVSWYLLGRCYEGLSQDSLALNCYEKSKLINPSYSLPYYNSANIFMENELYRSFEYEIKKALSIDSNNSEFWSKYSQFEFLRGRYEKAIFYSNKAIEVDSMNISAWYYNGLSYKNSNDNLSALNSFQYTLRIDSSFAKGWYEMAVVKKKLSYNDSDVWSDLKKSLVIDSTNHKAWYLFGLLMFKAGKFSDAIGAYQWSIDYWPENDSNKKSAIMAISYAYIGMANENLLHGDKENAIEYYRMGSEVVNDKIWFLKELESNCTFMKSKGFTSKDCNWILENIFS